MEWMAALVHLGVLTAIDTASVVHAHLVVHGFCLGVEGDSNALGVFLGFVEFLVDVSVGHAIGGDGHLGTFVGTFFGRL